MAKQYSYYQIDQILTGCRPTGNNQYSSSTKQAIATQVTAALKRFPTLEPSVGRYMYNNGEERSLFRLKGTIDTWNNGQQYHTPMLFWFQENFPGSPPICYVEATKGLAIARSHSEVSSDGVVWNNNLQQWEQSKGRGQSFERLLTGMQRTFGQHPPLYAASTMPAQQAQPSWQQPSINPYSSSSNPPGYAAEGQARAKPQPPPSYNTVVKSQEQKDQDEKERLLASVTQKVKVKLTQEVGKIKKACDKSSNEKHDMNKKKLMIEATLKALTEEEGKLKKRAAEIAEKSSEVQVWLESNETTEIKGEDLVSPVDTYSQQIIEATATSKAYDDVIYALKSARADGEIATKVFVKEVRKLARKQFYEKALVEKVKAKQAESPAPMIRSHAGPPPSYPGM